MRRSYWRALVGQLRAWFGGPGNVLLTVIGIVGVTVIGVLSAIFQLHGWAPVVVTAAVVLVFAEEVGFQAWKGQRGAIDQAHIAARQTAAFAPMWMTSTGGRGRLATRSTGTNSV